MDAAKYLERRQLLSQRHKNTLFLIPSGVGAPRSHSVEYRFKPASDFFYLCGLHLAGAVLLLFGDEAILFNPASGDALWGEFTDLAEEDAAQLTGLRLENRESMTEVVRMLLDKADRVAAALGRDRELDSMLLSMISYEASSRRTRRSPLSLCDSRALIGALRLIKDESELEALREAGRRSSKVHRALMEQSWIGKTERDVCAWIEGHFLLEGLPWTAYETIVGSGERSTILHARASNRRIGPDELVLIDAGGEWKGYCADITRVLPSGERFTPAQKDVYEIVLTAHHEAIRQVGPGVSLEELHQAASETLIRELARKGHRESEVRERIGELFPHNVGHWIGADVHDPSPYLDEQGRAIRLREGMCLTIEPGLYFRDPKFLGRYHGIGVRIEDNV
ncbi:MAG TPA: Xaa-Pro aminopeptidase, partial [Pseudobdellovibrionaceae bacterium]|nr:Xaa-Pro aminopeptidase [Pseudobdellovibrionaceae bacterium]